MPDTSTTHALSLIATAAITLICGLPRAAAAIAEQFRLDRQHRRDHATLILFADKYGPDAACTLKLLDVMEKGRGHSP